MTKPQKYNSISIAVCLLALLSLVCILLALTLGILSLARSPHEQETETDTETERQTERDVPVSSDPDKVILKEGPDAGMEYIDQMIFFGESTTAHLRSRGVLTGGTETKQVWADQSGTKTLSSQLLSTTIVYPETGESLLIPEAVERSKPKYMVLSFGLNNIVGFVGKKSLYVNNYHKLIDAIQAASPDTKIILQSVYPIANSNTDFSVDAETVNTYAQTLNEWLIEIASAHENVRFVDTGSVLRDADNALLPSYDSGDGVHLNVAAYEAILNYLRTHPWK